jgi:hypothetical protein
MKKVFVLQHAYECDDKEEIKLIGVYTSEDEARAAIRRRSAFPGFCDLPEGFHISELMLNEDQWTEGFVVIVHRENPDEEANRTPWWHRSRLTTHHVRPAPDGYWIYELFKEGKSLGCEVGRVGSKALRGSAVSLDEAQVLIAKDSQG